jgi:hypothetical protein
MSKASNTKVLIPPPLRAGRKGEPPPVKEASKNLEKPLEEEFVALNFRVPADFRKQVRQYALDNDITAVQLMMRAVEEYIQNKR